MSKEEARKITIIEELINGRFTNKEAALRLDLSIRQIQRLKAEATRNGATNILHKRRGMKPANSLDPVIVDKIVYTYQNELKDYNFCHATDVLAEDKGVFVSISSVSRYLKANGIRSPKAKRRPKKHRSRNARPCEGELIQMDASKFDWLSNGTYLHLHGAVDDATGKVLALYFSREETFDSYCELMFQMNRDDHLPREIYTDGRTVFCYNSNRKNKLSLEDELAGVFEKKTQFARAMSDLGILLIIAHSPQAKGSIERLWGTLQDRLAKDMKRHGITTIEQANIFLKRYINYYNRKFSVQAVKPEKAYLPKCDTDRLRILLSKHETRMLDSGLSFSFKGYKYVLPMLANGKKIPASPRDTLTVATSPSIGIQAIFKGLVFQPVQIKKQPKATILQKSNSHNHAKLNHLPQEDSTVTHPWRRHTNMFYSKNKRGDILPDQLCSVTHDIFADH